MTCGIAEMPPYKSANLPCISEMRTMHIEVMMFCLCRRAGHPCRKRRSKRVRRPWRRDVLRRGNRLVQGFPRSVRDCCSEDGFGPHESLHHHRSRKSNESHPHRPCRIISSHHTHHTNDAQSDRHPTTTETSNAVVIRAETVHWHDFEHSVVARHVDTAIENSRPHVSGGDGVGTDAVLGERCGKVT